MLLSAGATYASAVGAKSQYKACPTDFIVDPGNMALSTMVTALTGSGGCAAVAPAMPRSQAPLTTAEIATIRHWICEGAPNN